MKHKLSKSPDRPENVKDCKLCAEDKKSIPLSKYTMGSQTGGNLRAGWSKEGLERYTSFIDLCTEFRENDNFEDVVLFTLNSYEKACDRPTKRQKTSASENKKTQEADELESLFENILKKSKFEAV